MGALTGLPYALAALALLVIFGAIGYMVAGRGELPSSDAPKGLTKAEIAANVDIIAKALYYASSWSFSQSRALVLGHEGAMRLARAAVIDDGTNDVPTSLLEELTEYGSALDKAREDKAAQRSATCKRVTEALARLGAPFAVVGRQAKIAWSYGWALVKARKAGVCPYLHFRD